MELPTNPSSPSTEVYNPKAFIPHAALLRQAFAHCGRFPTAASRRSLDRVSVPVWPFTLSSRLTVKALVGRYPTNKRDGAQAHPGAEILRPSFNQSTMRRSGTTGY